MLTARGIINKSRLSSADLCYNNSSPVFYLARPRQSRQLNRNGCFVFGAEMDVCGIYKIVNLVNGNIYIGQSCHVNERFKQHFRLLTRNLHDNKHLQYAWNKYGEKNFVFEVILFCENYEATRYEQELVNRTQPAYNIRSICCLNLSFTWHD